MGVQREKSFGQQLAEKTLEQLMCMDLGHPWVPDPGKYVFSNRYTLNLVCSRCGAERDRITEDGYLHSNRMRYPEGYGFKGVGRRDRAERAEIRLSWMDAIPTREG